MSKKMAPTISLLNPNQKVPTRERILFSAHALFKGFGLDVAIKHVARAAETNVPTIERLFGGMDQLAQQYVEELTDECMEIRQAAMEVGNGDHGATLGCWIKYVATEIGNELSCFAQVCRGADDLWALKGPIFRQIRAYREDEQAWLYDLCQKAGYLRPQQLTDKLSMMVYGASSVRGYNAATRANSLIEGAEQLMAAHTPPMPNSANQLGVAR